MNTFRTRVAIKRKLKEVQMSEAVDKLKDTALRHMLRQHAWRKEGPSYMWLRLLVVVAMYVPFVAVVFVPGIDYIGELSYWMLNHAVRSLPILVGGLTLALAWEIGCIWLILKIDRPSTKRVNAFYTTLLVDYGLDDE